METATVTPTGSLPRVRVVGFEPVPSMSAPEDARNPLISGFLGGETITVSSPLSQMLVGILLLSQPEKRQGTGCTSRHC